MQDTIRQIVTQALQQAGIEPVAFVIEHPADLAHGDYACNAALVAAKKSGSNPRVLAEELSRYIETVQTPQVASVEVAGPGFLNFYLSRDFFKEKIAQIPHMGDRWGSNETLAGKTYLVEYTDPNPFKEFHIGHLFTNSVGESISRLIAFSGAHTKRLCYQGDVGLHVAHALYGMQQLGFDANSSFTAKDLGKAYALGASAYKEDPQAQQDIRALNKKIYDRSDESINALYDRGREVSLDYFESIYRMLGTQFDAYFFESKTGPAGKEVVLAHPKIFTQSDGAWVFNAERYGLHTRVFINAEGLPTYEAKELALAKLKADRLGDYDHSIIVTANEVSSYFQVIQKAMHFVYPDLAEKTEHIGHGMVRLQSGKMSSRTGDVIAALDFIREIADAAHARIAEASPHLADDDILPQQIALAAIKYSTLKGSILQDSVFDAKQALSFEGASGPYLQYTHARIRSLLEKANSVGIVPSAEHVPAEPYTVEKLLYRFPQVVLQAMQLRAPHKVSQYITDLAGAFNTFYAQEKIANPEDEYAPYKALVSQAVAQTLKNGLYLLGIESPNKM